MTRMSAMPLSNRKHEIYALLIAADFEPDEAYERAGFTPDEHGGNSRKPLRRREVIERIKALRGEAAEPVIPSAEPDAIRSQILEMAYDLATPAAQKIRALELLTEMNGKGRDPEYWPDTAEGFDASRLSEKQLRICQLYAARPAPVSPIDMLMAQLDLIRSRAA